MGSAGLASSEESSVPVISASARESEESVWESVCFQAASDLSAYIRRWGENDLGEGGHHLHGCVSDLGGGVTQKWVLNGERKRKQLTMIGSMFERMGFMDVVREVMSEQRAAKFNSNRGS